MDSVWSVCFGCGFCGQGLKGWGLKFQVLGLGCGFGDRAWGLEIQFFFWVYIFGCRVSGFGFRNLVLGRFRANRFVVGVGVVLADNGLDQRHVAPSRLEEIHQHCVCRGAVSTEGSSALCVQRGCQRHVAPPRLEEVHQHCVCRGAVS